jgi:hypothetical protein
LQFVLEAEAEIIREEGYWEWLRREQKIYLQNGVDTYEMPADYGELEYIRPGNWNNRPLTEIQPVDFYNMLNGVTQSGGQPRVFLRVQPGPNEILQIRIYPKPVIQQVTSPGQTEDPFMFVQYFARQLWPYEPDAELPFVPASDIDVLIYKAAAAALLLDTDPDNREAMMAEASRKVGSLRRKNNRNMTNRISFKSAADVFRGNVSGQIPLTRAASLDSLLLAF